MTQEAIAISTTPPLPGLQMVQQANGALATIATDFAGSVDPASLAGAYMTWADTGTGTLWRRNAAGSAWVEIGRVLERPLFASDVGTGVIPTASFKNKLINAQGIVNQRNYVSGTATTGALQYTLDRWRVVTSGQNLTSTLSGIFRIMTAPAGGVEQVVESLCMEGGSYSLSWTGTATATVNGTPVANGASISLPAATNATVRFTGGTFSLPQLELGVATPFEYLPPDAMLGRCQRYFESSDGNMAYTQPGNSGAIPQRLPIPYKVSKRASPSVSVVSAVGSVVFAAGNANFVTFAFGGTSQQENQWSWTANAEL
ncbi:hypothetical protein [Achromobacter sp. ACRQX]|uniref:hypothetical protein n=1 Tax=Achromobacter sp. ACRQX TaxID=2918181 RepID=UPI001EF16FE6|nr:hypothetical protein [Achromobacter sp. ACRQX]MCG7328069.1 hypothetical protein [Achromobacter sp. ACRQX]